MLGGAEWHGYTRGANTIKQADAKVVAKQVERNATSFSKADATTQVTGVKIVYRDRVVKEYIREKEHTNIDVNIHYVCVFLMDDSAANTESSSIIDDSTEAVAISRVTTTVTSNYADCNYDKIRLATLQKFVLENGFIVESN